jgi:hypothetical protein
VRDIEESIATLLLSDSERFGSTMSTAASDFGTLTKLGWIESGEIGERHTPP